MSDASSHRILVKDFGVVNKSVHKLFAMSVSLTRRATPDQKLHEIRTILCELLTETRELLR